MLAVPLSALLFIAPVWKTLLIHDLVLEVMNKHDQDFADEAV